ncbi:MAG: amino acid/amide transporter substrate-binding protein family [Deltaproteobacteria bacterium]|nr:amino acid/amide transporter substrate-binding protein family [Deltaproteobacteria bacterium]
MKRSTFTILAVVVGLAAGLVSMQPEVLGQGKEPIKIGMIADSTGGLAAYGYSHERVLRAAIKKINGEGGISGRPIELYVEDTESKPPVGALKFRKLVESNGVSFVIDSNSSGVAIACAPIAKELKTPYFPCAGATEISGENGNRYVFQPCTNVRQEAKGVAKFAAEKIGKKWVTVVVNYAWGWSNEKEFIQFIKEAGGEVLTSIRVPLGTGDWLPYLAGKIPKEAEAVYFANFGSDFLSFIRDLHAVRPDIKKLGAVYAISAQDTQKLGEAAEGLYCIAPYPTRYEGLKTDFNKAYRDMINVDPEGVEVGTGKRFVLAYNWAVWESMFLLKAGIEKSGKGNKDTPRLIETLEGMTFKQGIEFPQGEGYVRKEDHLSQVGLYIEQIRKGVIEVVARIPPEAVVYTPEKNHSKEAF